jgi:cell division protein FtsA
VGARLEEIFELVQAELKKAGRAGKLPSGVVLVGGGSTMAGMVEFVKRELDLAATIGKPTGFGGVEDRVEKPAFAAAVGLMFLDIEASGGGSYSKNNKPSSQSSGVANGIKNVFNKLTKRSRK